MRHTLALTLTLSAALAPTPALAQEHAHAHLGTVHFATSCRPAVAPTFDRAVALLHSFEFGASIRGFQEVLATDSTCAMAHWGIALSRWGNPMAAGARPVARLAQGREDVAAARRAAPGATPRERGYIDAVATLYDDFETVGQPARIAAYERAMRGLARREPADTEAAIFHAIALAASASPTDKTYAAQLEAGRTLEALWARLPDHPGLAHYIIHSYDAPALAHRARRAAERYAGIAPDAAHALHMPSHTFTRVGLWQESVETNQRSMRAALATGSIGEALHAADYLVYAELQMGREADARRIVDSLPLLRARFDPTAITGAAPGSAGVFALAAIPARWVLERRAWGEASALQPVSSPWPYAEAMTWLVRALAGSHLRDLAMARTAVDSLASIQRRLASSGESYWAEQVAIQQLTARAWLSLAEGREAEALSRMREAVAREDATEKSAVTPGPLAPARELLGDMLLQLGRKDEARAEYRATLVKEPGRRHSSLGAAGRVQPPPALIDSTPRRRAAIDLSGAWATGSTGEPDLPRIVIQGRCNYSPALWILEQRGDSVFAWKIPESHAQGIATPHAPRSTPDVGRISGVNVTIGQGATRYLLRYDSTSGHLRGTLNGAPFWAIRKEVVRPTGCIPVP